MITYFYKILDPSKSTIYVGVTTRKVTDRFHEHLKNKNLDSNYTVVTFDSIVHPSISSLKIFYEEYRKVVELEQKYIKEEKSKGSKLLNLSPGGEWGAHILYRLQKEDFFKTYGTYEGYIQHHNKKIKFKQWLTHWIYIRSSSPTKTWLSNWILHRKTIVTKQWLQNWIINQSKSLTKSWLRNWIRHKTESKIKTWLICCCNLHNNKTRVWLYHWINHKTISVTKKWLQHWVSHKKENKTKAWLKIWINTKTTAPTKIWISNWVLHKSENKVKVWLNNWINHKKKDENA